MSQNNVEQSQINNAAWAACDTFRGTIDAASYKDYILVMLFLKYISDVYTDHLQKYQKELGKDKIRIERRLQRERFILPEVKIKDPQNNNKVVDKFIAHFDSLYERREQTNIGELINITLEAIEETNKEKLDGVFRNIDFNSEANLGKTKDRNRRLKNLLEDFHKPELNLSPSRVNEDIIGECYIYLISRFASDAGKKAGEFYTPACVSHLLAKLATAQPGNTIFDPTCGSGSLLIEAAKEVGDNNFALFGQESNGATWALARMNMFLHGMDAARIEWCDTLNSPALLQNNGLMKFDIVLANPPFSLDKWGHEEASNDRFKRFHRGIPPKSKGDYAFITHMIETAKRLTGRVAVIVPHGVLFRGSSEGKIRQALIEENLLDAVIGLPEKLFTTTGIPVAILIFDRSREQGGENESRKDILFIDASREFESTKNRNYLSAQQIDKIVQTYNKRKTVDKYAYLAKPAEIKENEYNLNIPRYVDTFEEEEEIDIAALQVEIDDIENELSNVRKQMNGYLKELGILK
jgi:type I restriction enzyme M protein